MRIDAASSRCSRVTCCWSAERSTGSKDAFFELEKTLVKRWSRRWAIKLKPRSAPTLGQGPDRRLRGVPQFSQGICRVRREAYQDALDALTDATKRDKDFKLATRRWRSTSGSSPTSGRRRRPWTALPTARPSARRARSRPGRARSGRPPSNSCGSWPASPAVARPRRTASRPSCCCRKATATASSCAGRGGISSRSTARPTSWTGATSPRRRRCFRASRPSRLRTPGASRRKGRAWSSGRARPGRRSRA